MATFNITTPVNIDSLTSKAGNDTYNINGGYLTIDQDSRYGLNQNTSAVLGNVTISSTLGGTVEINATKVRIIPYDTGSGNVPASNTTISQGSASGLLIGVYSSLTAAPTTAGSAMPASGFIKIKQWNDVAFAAGALTGIGASATAADRVGWIEIGAQESSAFTVPRLGVLKVRGEWFDLGTTDGNRATTYQIPSNNVNQYHSGVQVETSAGSGVYEWYPCAGSKQALASAIATDAIRGKVCWISNTGVLRFGHDGTNSTGGYCPPTGCKVRIPNIFMQNSTSVGLTANTVPNATLGSRMETVTTSGGVIDIDRCSCCWYLNMSQPFSVSIINSGIITGFLVSKCATPLVLTSLCVGQEGNNTQFALTMTLNIAGGTVSDCVFSRALLGGSGNYTITVSDCEGFEFSNMRLMGLAERTNATTGAATLTRLANSIFDDCVIGNGRMFLTTCTDIEFNNCSYYDHPAINTISTNPMAMFDLASNCSAIYIDGIHFNGLKYVQPYNSILNIGAAGCTDVKLRNIGTYAAPIPLGGSVQYDKAYTRATTTATVTETAHGLAVNDTIYVIISDSTAAIVLGAKTITAVTTDTFSFGCLNGGAASGVISYFATKTGHLFVLAASAGATNVKVQRCFISGCRTNLFSSDNSSSGIIVEDVHDFGYITAPVVPCLNATLRNVSAAFPMTVQSSTYGSHFFNSFNRRYPSDVTAVAWTRATTTATVTVTDHGLYTGDTINVTASSSLAAIVLGSKTVTVLTKDTFTFTCLNAGDASGTIDFDPCNSRLGILMNEPTADTDSQVVVTLAGATGGFNSVGGLYLPTVNDECIFTTPSFILGVTGFSIMEPVMAGGTLANYTLSYQIDKNDGAGFSAYRNLYYPRAGGSGSGGATTFTVTNATGVEVGDYAWGTGIAPLAKVTNVNTGTNTVTVDTANTGAVSGVIRFGGIGDESGLDPALGVKLKIRVRTSTANATTITSIYLLMQSTNAARSGNQYPLDLANLTLTGLQNLSDVVILEPGTSNEYDNTDQNIGSTYSIELDAGVISSVDIGVFKTGYVPLFIRNLPLTAAGASIPIAQIADRNYAP